MRYLPKVDQQGTKCALGLRQTWPGKKETHALPDPTLHHVRHPPSALSKFRCVYQLGAGLSFQPRETTTKNKAQDVRPLGEVWSVVVPL